MNVLEEALQTIVAWDNNKIVPNPRPSLSTLGSLPRKVSSEILNPVRDSISKSPVKVRFAGHLPLSPDKSQGAIHQRIEKANGSSTVKTIDRDADSAIHERLEDGYDDDVDEAEKERLGKIISENFLSRLDSTPDINSVGFIVFRGSNLEESFDQLDEEMKVNEEGESQSLQSLHSQADPQRKDECRTQGNSRQNYTSCSQSLNPKASFSPSERRNRKVAPSLNLKSLSPVERIGLRAERRNQVLRGLSPAERIGKRAERRN